MWGGGGGGDGGGGGAAFHELMNFSCFPWEVRTKINPPADY